MDLIASYGDDESDEDEVIVPPDDGKIYDPKDQPIFTDVDLVVETTKEEPCKHEPSTSVINEEKNEAVLSSTSVILENKTPISFRVNPKKIVTALSYNPLYGDLPPPEENPKKALKTFSLYDDIPLPKENPKKTTKAFSLCDIPLPKENPKKTLEALSLFDDLPPPKDNNIGIPPASTSEKLREIQLKECVIETEKKIDEEEEMQIEKEEEKQIGKEEEKQIDKEEEKQMDKEEEKQIEKEEENQIDKEEEKQMDEKEEKHIENREENEEQNQLDKKEEKHIEKEEEKQIGKEEEKQIDKEEEKQMDKEEEKQIEKEEENQIDKEEEKQMDEKEEKQIENREENEEQNQLDKKEEKHIEKEEEKQMNTEEEKQIDKEEEKQMDKEEEKQIEEEEQNQMDKKEEKQTATVHVPELSLNNAAQNEESIGKADPPEAVEKENTPLVTPIQKIEVEEEVTPLRRRHSLRVACIRKREEKTKDVKKESRQSGGCSPVKKKRRLTKVVDSVPEKPTDDVMQQEIPLCVNIPVYDLILDDIPNLPPISPLTLVDADNQLDEPPLLTNATDIRSSSDVPLMDSNGAVDTPPTDTVDEMEVVDDILSLAAPAVDLPSDAVEQMDMSVVSPTAPDVDVSPTCVRVAAKKTLNNNNNSDEKHEVVVDYGTLKNGNVTFRIRKQKGSTVVLVVPADSEVIARWCCWEGAEDVRKYPEQKHEFELTACTRINRDSFVHFMRYLHFGHHLPDKQEEIHPLIYIASKLNSPRALNALCTSLDFYDFSIPDSFPLICVYLKSAGLFPSGYTERIFSYIDQNAEKFLHCPKVDTVPRDVLDQIFRRDSFLCDEELILRVVKGIGKKSAERQGLSLNQSRQSTVLIGLPSNTEYDIRFCLGPLLYSIRRGLLKEKTMQKCLERGLFQQEDSTHHPLPWSVSPRCITFDCFPGSGTGIHNFVDRNMEIQFVVDTKAIEVHKIGIYGLARKGEYKVDVEITVSSRALPYSVHDVVIDCDGIQRIHYVKLEESVKMFPTDNVKITVTPRFIVEVCKFVVEIGDEMSSLSSSPITVISNQDIPSLLFTFPTISAADLLLHSQRNSSPKPRRSNRAKAGKSPRL